MTAGEGVPPCMMRSARRKGSRETEPTRVNGASSTTITQMKSAMVPAKVAVVTIWNPRSLAPKK